MYYVHTIEWLLPFIALLAAALTLFTGFGLATVLTPFVAIFLPIEQAVVLVATVHLLNNIFKWILLGGAVDWHIVAWFGIPAILAAYVGSLLLVHFPAQATLLTYAIGGKSFQVLPLKLTVGLLMITITILELTHFISFKNASLNWLPLGGLLSGFVGGFSGHQGALRSLFLAGMQLTPAGFVATGVVLGCLVDIARMLNYVPRVPGIFAGHALVILVTILASFIGSYVASRFVQKMTLPILQGIVSIGIILVSLAIIAGLV